MLVLTQTYAHEYPVEGLYMWDIGMALRIAQDKEVFNISLPDALITKETIGSLCSVDADYAMTTDLSKPILFAPYCGIQHTCIDGWHRVYKAVMTGVEVLTCRILTQEESERCLIIKGGIIQDRRI